MIHGMLNKFRDNLRTIDMLREEFFPTLSELDEVGWNDSKLADTKGNQLDQSYHALEGQDRIEISDVMRNIPAADLVENQGISQDEMLARRGLLLMQQAYEKLGTEISASKRTLHRIQTIRETGMIELERRSRENMIRDGGGESLDAFTSRFIFGPEPPTMVPPKNPEQGPKKKDFYIARCKTGKLVFVRNLVFSIPEVYDTWLVQMLTDMKLHEPQKWGRQCAPRNTTAGIAKAYYALGFKPDKIVTVEYKCHWYNSTWNNGWHLSHSRQLPTKELVPVD